MRWIHFHDLLRVHDFAARHLGPAIIELTFQITTTSGQQNCNGKD